MFFLAGTAFCSSDAYDPNPYDDIPPVVTVEFNYLIPGQLSAQVSHAADLRNHGKLSTTIQRRQPQSIVAFSKDQQTPSACLQSTPPAFVPLRR